MVIAEAIWPAPIINTLLLLEDSRACRETWDNLELSFVRHLPNALSFFRLASGFLIIPLYNSRDARDFALAVALIVAAELTDHLDGRLARHLHTATVRGYILDGLADRSLYGAVILALSCEYRVNDLTVWLLIFGQIAIYAVRLMHSDWEETNINVRKLHLAHWGGIRVWVLSFLVLDAHKRGFLNLSIDFKIYSTLQNITAAFTILILYYSIAVDVSNMLGAEVKQSN